MIEAAPRADAFKLPLTLADRCEWEVRGRSGVLKTKILLVDDSRFLRLATERALVRSGYEVVTAGDGEAALEIARKEHPEVILLDMLLPKMSGPDVLKALKQRSGNVGHCGRGIHRNVTEKCGATAAGWSGCISGKI